MNSLYLKIKKLFIKINFFYINNLNNIVKMFIYEI